MSTNFVPKTADLVKSISRAYVRISPHLVRTPVFTSEAANAITGRKIFFKADNLQKTGSFKVRGALNSVLRLKESGKPSSGVVTHSSGNHALALAWSARLAGLPCYAVISQLVPEIKRQAIRNYGATIVDCGNLISDRVEATDRLQREMGLKYVSTSDDYDVMAGQGTMAFELMEQVPNLDAIVLAVGGGGLASGVALFAKAINPNIKIYLVAPKAKNLGAFLRTGKRFYDGPVGYIDTIADGVRIKHLSQRCVPFMQDLTEKDVFDVEDPETIEGTRFAFEDMKLVIEPAAGTVFAAIFSQQFQELDPSIKRVGVVICGGNTDVDNLPWMSSYRKKVVIETDNDTDCLQKPTDESANFAQ